jgi:putative Holliday junction resolvase
MNEQCLGIDWGGARIGLALGNAETKIASPFATVASLEDIQKVIGEEGIERLVIGQPVQDEDHELNPQFSEFLEAITLAVDIPISLIDERFTSQAADQLDRNARRRGEQDSIAAMLILQAYFDALK